MVDWSDERIAALSDQDLKNLLVNAERKSAAGVIAQCKAEIEKRDAAKPRKAAKPRTEVKEFEHEMSAELAAVGKEMAEKYDLSEETAKARSAGVKGFRAHKLLDAKGYAKLGGHQRDGTVAVDRYISYRRGNDIVSLGVWLPKDAPIEDHEFHVSAPAAMIEGGKPLPKSGQAFRKRKRQRARHIARLQGPAERGRRLRRGAGEDHGLKQNRHCERKRSNPSLSQGKLDCFCFAPRNDENKNRRKHPCPRQNASFSSLARSASPRPSDFRIEECALPTPGQGQVLLRTIWLSLDPYMRGRMSDGPSYAAPVPIGGVMEGGTVCEVIASNNPGFAKGDIVLSRAGWQTHALSDGKGLRKSIRNSDRSRPRSACSACPA